MSMNLAGKKLAITGAGGFIGARTMQLARERGLSVRGLELSPRAAERLSGEVIVGDMCDPNTARRLCEGADFVFHTAAKVGEGGDFDEYRRINVEATRTLAEAAALAGVKCFVHVSSVMVYGFRFPPFVAEDGPLRGEGDAYCQTKIESEGVLRPFRSRMRIVIIRPGDVYGPGSAHWIVRPLEMIRRGLFSLPGRGDGIMNHVYVDNLVEAVLLSMEREVEGAFNVTDGAATTFKTYFDLLASMAGRGGVRTIPAPLMKAALGMLAERARRRGVAPEALPASVDYLSRPHPYSIERARRLLGYRPGVLLEQGMQNVREWLKSERLI